MSKKWSVLLLFVLLASTFLTACCPGGTVVVTQVVPQTGQPGGVVKETVEVVVPETVVPVPPTPVPVDRKGAWVDQIVIVEEPNTAAGITRLESGELDVPRVLALLKGRDNRRMLLRE